MKGSPLTVLSAVIATLGLAALAFILPGYLTSQQQLSRLEKQNVYLANRLTTLEIELTAATNERDAAQAEVDSLWQVVLAETAAKDNIRVQLATAEAALFASQTEVARLSSELVAAKTVASNTGSNPVGKPANNQTGSAVQSAGDHRRGP